VEAGQRVSAELRWHSDATGVMRQFIFVERSRQVITCGHIYIGTIGMAFPPRHASWADTFDSSHSDSLECSQAKSLTQLSHATFIGTPNNFEESQSELREQFQKLNEGEVENVAADRGAVTPVPVYVSSRNIRSNSKS